MNNGATMLDGEIEETSQKRRHLRLNLNNLSSESYGYLEGKCQRK